VAFGGVTVGDSGVFGTEMVHLSGILGKKFLAVGGGDRL
jgi:hypothetical protein